MARPPLRQTLQRNSRQAGFWLTLCSPTVAEIAAGSGVDWLLLDMEHSPNDLSQVPDQLRAAESAPGGGTVEIIVRLPVADQTMTKRLLDVGVRNLMFPMIQTANDAELAVSWTRYPPDGVRGISATVRANEYGRQAGYATSCADALCVIVQVETPEAVDNIAQIAAVPGVDAIFVGPGDLAATMGHVGNPMHRDVQACIAQAITAIHDAGLPAGILGFGKNAAQGYFAQGFEFVAIAGDAWLLTRQLDALVRDMTPAPGDT